ncbi:hypothetical protein PspLS_08587 [Pyricularia sp. CBS 133598]|nr:hypothetical protein PspLS_08587 [Pyricularia sp. CBS 133598]
MSKFRGFDWPCTRLVTDIVRRNERTSSPSPKLVLYCIFVDLGRIRGSLNFTLGGLISAHPFTNILRPVFFLTLVGGEPDQLGITVTAFPSQSQCFPSMLSHSHLPVLSQSFLLIVALFPHLVYSLAAILALAGSAIAQTPGFHALVKPVRDEVIPAGKPFTLEWQAGGQDGPVNFVLTGGETHALLQEIGTVATGIDSKLGKYTWDVSATLGDKKAYGLKIVLASDPTVFQWSNPFTIKATSDKPSNNNSTSAAPSTITSPSSAAPTAASTTLVKTNSTTVSTNASMTATKSSAPGGATTLTKTSTQGVAQPTRATTPSSPQATGAAAALGFSSAALVGGVFMAVLGL